MVTKGALIAPNVATRTKSTMKDLASPRTSGGAMEAESRNAETGDASMTRTTTPAESVFRRGRTGAPTAARIAMPKNPRAAKRGTRQNERHDARSPKAAQDTTVP